MTTKNLFMGCLMAITAITGKAQQSDSAYTEGGTKDVYYSFLNGVADAVDNRNWDIAFEIKGFLSGIHVNEQAGNQLYITPYDVASWANFDSAGMKSWPVSHNGTANWSEGAFNTNIASEFDLGWGTYDINTHSVVGDSIYLLKTRSGSWKKIYIESLASGTFLFKYANVDGSGEMTVQIKKSDYNTVNFAYYDVDGDKALNREPNTTAWDIVFTKYLLAVPAGPTFQYYPVSGVKINKGRQVAERNGTAVSNNDTNALAWGDDISEIGSDWKTWTGTAYAIKANQSFFVRTAEGQVWKLYFTGFTGGMMGTSYFVKENLSGSVAVEDISETGSQSVYPNPASGYFHIQNLPSARLDRVDLMDLGGRVLKSWTEQERYQVSELPAGVYMLGIHRSSGSELQRLILH